jgi:hypothetical protein
VECVDCLTRTSIGVEEKTKDGLKFNAVVGTRFGKLCDNNVARLMYA